MDALFPFGFPLSSAIYLVLYVFTLVLHVIFMNYVLAGTGFITLSTFVGRTDEETPEPSPGIEILRDWMPFALSGAITAAIAPLLFVQILYQKPFYTANLLLFHRWMSILPVLILGFYLLYLLKARRIESWPAALRQSVSVVAFLCFAFTGYSWTENHLLSLDQSEWASQYASQSMWYSARLTAPRFGTWFFGAIPTMFALLLWQLRFRRKSAGRDWDGQSIRRWSVASVGALLLSVVCAVWYYKVAGSVHQSAIWSSQSWVYLIVAITGLLFQAAGWVSLARGDYRMGWHAVISLGVLFTIAGTSVVRECIRIAHMDLVALEKIHAAVAAAGGLPIFLVFFVLNAVLIYASIRLVRSELTRPEGGPGSHTST